MPQKPDYNINTDTSINKLFSQTLTEGFGFISSAYGAEKANIARNLMQKHNLSVSEVSAVFGTKPRALQLLLRKYPQFSPLTNKSEQSGQTGEKLFGEATKVVGRSHKAIAVGSIPAPQTNTQAKSAD